MDSLLLLRKYISSHQPIEDRGAHLSFGGEWRAQKSAPTSCRSSAGSLYTVETLWFLASRPQFTTAAGEYAKEARRLNIPTVSFEQRKEILDFLNGKIAECSFVDRTALVPLAERETAKRPAEPMEAEGVKEARASEDGVAAAAAVGAGEGAAASGLSLSKEKISELQEKRRAAKMAQKSDDVELRAAISADVDAILLRERVYDDRNSVLRGRGRRPLKAVLDLVLKDKKPSKPAPAPAAPRPQDYDRYNQQGRKEGGGFAIDQYGSFLQTAKPASTPAAPAAPAAARPAQTQGAKPVLKKRQPQTPIIMVPASSKTLVTLYNSKLFLEEGKFETAMDVMNRGQVKPQDELIHRKVGHKSVPYKVMDGTRPLTPDQWERVIAVFVAGPAWQFKEFPWGGNPVEIFTQIKGFHLKYTDDKMDPNVQAWDVTVLQIDRSQRFKDSTAQHKFWEVLDDFVEKRRPVFSVANSMHQ